MRIAQWARRLWYLVNRRRLERELAREMAAHRGAMAEPHRFGNTLRLREEAADVWGWRWLDDLRRDLRFGVRQLVRAPGFAATAILTLAIGIGANTAIFSVVNSLLLRTLPVEDPERLAILGDAIRPSPSWSEPVWEQIRTRPELFDGAFAWSSERLNLARGGEAQFVDGVWVSGEFFDVLGVHAALGRTFARGDDQPGGGADGPVAVISDDFWRRRFAASRDVLGRPLFLDSVAFTIVGVTPPGFFGTEVGQSFDVAIPIAAQPLLRGNNSSLGLATRNWLSIMVRLRRGQTLDEATTALRGIQPQIRDAILPQVPPGLRTVILGAPLALAPAARGESALREQYSRPLVVLLVVVGLVLLVACVNIANLLLARAVARRYEMNVRIAIGASRARLARMLLAEASVLAAIGAVLGFGLSLVLGQLLVHQLSTRTATVFVDLTSDWRVLVFTLAVSMVTVALFGAAPAWHATRATPDGAVRQQEGGRVGGGRSSVTGVLVGTQLALSLVLIVGAGLFIRTFAELASQDFGFRKERVLVVDVAAPMTRYTLPQLVRVYERVREVVDAVPGVERAALSDITPIGGTSRNAIVGVPGMEDLPRDDQLIMVNVVSPGWFATYGTRLLAGRDFALTDRPATPPVAVVNESFVRRFFKGTSPVGRVVGVGGSRLEIVGLVEDAVYQSVRDPAPPTLYTSATQREAARPFVRISVLAAIDRPALLASAIESAIGEIDSGLTLQFHPLAEQVDAAMNQERLVARLSGFFGLLAVLLASVGLYGVTAYAVSRRKTEIGVRLALGAARSSVVRLVMRGVLRPVIAGITAGALLSLWLAKFVGTLTWGLTARDPATFFMAAAILAGVGTFAGWLPARRASRIQPVAALRE